jgi:hypothetical protein
MSIDYILKIVAQQYGALRIGTSESFVMMHQGCPLLLVKNKAKSKVCYGSTVVELQSVYHQLNITENVPGGLLQGCKQVMDDLKNDDGAIYAKILAVGMILAFITFAFVPWSNMEA